MLSEPTPTPARPILLAGYDAHRIAPRLWMGARPEPHWRLPMFSLVIYCAREWQPAQTAHVGSVWYCPLDDSYYPPDAREKRRARAAAFAAVAELRRGGRVLVTCLQGRNRSGLVTALALEQLWPRVSTQGILDAIRAERPTAMANRNFVEHVHGVRRRRGQR